MTMTEGRSMGRDVGGMVIVARIARGTEMTMMRMKTVGGTGHIGHGEDYHAHLSRTTIEGVSESHAEALETTKTTPSRTEVNVSPIAGGETTRTMIDRGPESRIDEDEEA